MPLLGYALFNGEYGEFTVPVFSAPGFSIGSDPLIGYPLYFSESTYNSISWNTAKSIYGLVVEPERTTPSNPPTYSKEFVASSSPVVGITCTDSTAVISGAVWPDDYMPKINIWVDEVLTEAFIAYEPSGNAPIGKVYVDPVPCIFRLDDGKYYPMVSEYSVKDGSGRLAEFVFLSRYNKTYYPLDSIDIQQTPVLIGDTPAPVPEPDNIIIDPAPAYMALNSELQFTAKYTYDNGDEIPVNPSNGKWSLEDNNGEPLDDGASITDNGLVSLGDFNNSEFYVKVTWEGSSYNVTKTTPVYITDSPTKGDIYTPGIGSGNPSIPSGGSGNFGIDPSTGQPVQSDDIVSSLPGIGTPSGSYEGSVANAGLFVHYAMNAPILEEVGSWLWTSDLGLVIAKEFMSILYGSPIESAISLMSYPFNITALNGVVSNMQRIVWGSQQLTDTLGDIRAPAITNPYATIDWGTVQLTEFWGNFLDYAPHTKLELYLPWCTGFVPIDPNECLPGSLRVVTNIELAKGTCLHNVIGNDGRVIATHTGTCGKQLPLTALDTSGKALSMITAAVSTAIAGSAGAAATRAGEIAYGNYLAGARQLGLTPSEAVTGGHAVRQEAMAPHIKNQNRARNMALAGSAAAARVPSSVHRNGSFTGSTAGLGVQYPYLIISRPTQSVPKQYGHHYGYPSNIYTSLLTLRGYTEIGEIHLTGFTCTEDELTEIDSLLKSGVIL